MASVKLPAVVSANADAQSRHTSRPPTGQRGSFSANNPTHHNPSPPSGSPVLGPADDPVAPTAPAASADVAPPSLSHLVAQSLANAAAHERAILKWSREIAHEMEEYRSQVARAKQQRNIYEMEHGGRFGGKRGAPDPKKPQLGRQTTLHMAHDRNVARPSDRDRDRDRDLAWTSGAGFLRDDIQSVNIGRGKARFYPTQLVKVDTRAEREILRGGSKTARDSSPKRSARKQATAAAAGSLSARAHASNDDSNNDHMAPAVETAIVHAHSTNSNPMYTMYGAAQSKHAPNATNALLSLPPALSTTDLKPVVGNGSVEMDEAATFKSPALYMDMKMRQLFHPDVNAAPVTTSQKAHTIAHLVDVLGELVEPDSQQAYQILADTIKELMLASEYRNLIPVSPQQAQGIGGGPAPNAAQPSPTNASNPSALNGTLQPAGSLNSTLSAASTAMVNVQRDLHRREKSKWNLQGHSRHSSINQKPNPPSYDNPSKTLMQSLADGSLDGPGGLVGGRFMTAAEKAKEKERLEREKIEADYFQKQQLAKQQAAHASQMEEEGKRRGKPIIAFEGDADEGLAKATVPIDGIVPYRNPALVIPPSLFPMYKQIPASFIEVAFSLKEDVEMLCARLESVSQALQAQQGEMKRKTAEHQYLHNWNVKKSLQLQLYTRSEANLSNEIILLKNLLIDLKDEFETINEENILLEEDYLAHGIVFGGSYAMEEFRFEEEHRNYPVELRQKKREMELTLARIENFKKDLLDIHTERDLLLTRIEVLEQAVNMMHNDEDEDEDEDEEDEDGDGDDEEDEEERRRKKGEEQSKKEEAESESQQAKLDPMGYPFKQQRLDDLRGRGMTNMSVPIFLRFNGHYPNLNYSKQEVEVRIKEIWSLKTIADEKAKQVGGNQTNLKDYFQEYLWKRFKSGPSASAAKDTSNTSAKGSAAPSPRNKDSPAGGFDDPFLPDWEDPSVTTPAIYAQNEFVLNFFTTLEKNFIDQDFILFLKVIYGELNEEHYRDQMKMLANFKDAIFRLDLAEHDVKRGERIDGLITKSNFIKGLREFFPHKTDRHMNELIAILERDCMHQNQVDGRKILSEGGDLEDDLDEGNNNDGVSSNAGNATPTAGGDSLPSQTTPGLEGEKLPANGASAAAQLDDTEPNGGYTSNFLECIRHQYLLEIDAFVARIRADLYALYDIRKVEKAKSLAANEENSNSYSAMRHLERSDTRPPALTAYDIRYVLRNADVNRSTESLTDFLKRGCNEPYLSKDTEIQIERFMMNLVQSGLVHTTNHWRRLPLNTPSLDAAHSNEASAREAENKRRSVVQDVSDSPATAFGTLKPFFNRRASMEDEGSYFAARHTEAAATSSHTHIGFGMS